MPTQLKHAVLEYYTLFSYILGELDESLAQFLVVPFYAGVSIFTLSVLTANHVVELWRGHQTIV